MGACVQAAIISGDISSENGLIVADVSPIGLGIDMLGERGGQVMLVYEPLMPPNTKIPYSVKRSYSLLHPDQRECSFRLYQDRTGTAKLPEDAEDTGVVGELKEIPPALYGSPHPVEVEFSYNLDGRAQIRASIPGLGKSLEIGYELSSKYMSHEDKEAAKERIASSTASQRAPEQAKWQQHPRASEFSSLFSKAESSATSLDSDRRERLLAAVVKLKAALEQNQSQSFDKLENELIDLLFELDS
jgi:molecular chaperone DnaK